MTDEAQRWKEKYLKSIEQQDKLEKRWNARLDLLRRGLVRSSLAAEGADRAVDQCMKEMREIVRKDDMDAGLAALIPRLEKAVLDSEQRREQRVEQMGTALTSLVTQLQSLPLPREVAKPLKKFAKGLEDRVNQAREIPLLLSELSGLQGKAFAELEHPEEASRPGLLQRLFGHREPAEQADDGSPEGHTPVPAPVPKPAPVASDDHDDEPAKSPESAAASSTQWVNEAPPLPVADKPTASVVEVPAAKGVEVPAVNVVEESAEPAPVVATANAEAATVIANELEPAAHVVLQPAEPAASVEPPARPEAGTEPGAGSDEAVADSEEPVIEQAPVEAQPDPEQVIEEDPQSDDAYDVDDEADETEAEETEAEEVEEDEPYALPSSPEPSYSSVAAHIEETLLGLLDELTLPEHHRPQAEAMRSRLKHGLNWYELLPILDDLAVLMLAITDSGQHEFELYLKQLNERLESFQANLQAASADHAGQQSASRELNEQLREHVGDLQTSVQEAADLDSLKFVLESRLEGLLGTMDHHQTQRDQREQEVASRLQSLASRVATMEQEALGFRAHLEEQRQKALIDTLTGLPNRAAWNERLDQEVERLQKNRSSLLLGILDLDHFKRINDGYGHLAGDKVLKIVATQLKKKLRTADFMARFGGEEFVVLLPHTQMAEGVTLLEQLRQTVEQCPFHFKGEPVTITVSMGITLFRPGERSDLVLKRADQALYRAKDQGRNRIEQG